MGTISQHMEFASEQERTVVTWIAEDESAKICTSELLETLSLFECIRITLPRQYVAAVTDSILLRVLTKQTLSKELDNICSDQHASQLFSTREDISHLSVTRPRNGDMSTLRGAIVIPAVGCLLLLAISAAIRGMRRCALVTPTAYAGVGASSTILDPADTEQGFLAGDEPRGIL